MSGPRFAATIAGLGAAGFLGAKSVYNVPPGCKAAVYNRSTGKVEDELKGEGGRRLNSGCATF
jgi:hypothetical protein